ncbi:hypothetical protein VNO80_27033 [Phaseolus coccineus]|uniref:Uncharacterized protein n=1 Tax=Phaseolus coccineus TaxID=3886 RepID=A0AAN9QHP4_PHACN
MNIPKYRRHQLEPYRAERRVLRAPNTGRQKETGKRHLKDAEVGGKQRSKEIWVEKKGKKSFVDAVTVEPQERWKGPVIKTQQQGIDVSEKIGEEEVRPWVGDEGRSKGEEEGGEVMEEGEQNMHRTNLLFEGSSSKSNGCQGKGVNSITNEGRKGQKVYASSELIFFSDKVYGDACFSYPTQTEVAKIVMDIEFKTNQEDTPVASALERKMEAHLGKGWVSYSA